MGGHFNGGVEAILHASAASFHQASAEIVTPSAHSSASFQIANAGIALFVKITQLIAALVWAWFLTEDVFAHAKSAGVAVRALALVTTAGCLNLSGKIKNLNWVPHQQSELPE